MRNASATSGAAASVAITITGVPGYQARLYAVDCYTSAGTSQVTVTDGGTQIWASSPGFCASTGLSNRTWTKSLDGSPGATMIITASSAGGGNTVTLSVEADSF